jgi:hypothetical protein
MNSTPSRSSYEINAEAAGGQYIAPTVRSDLYEAAACAAHPTTFNSSQSGGNGGGGGPGNSSLSLITLSSGFASVQQLPEFPTFAEYGRYLEPTISEERFHSLLTMYRAHAQRIMDSVNKFSFAEVIVCIITMFLYDKFLRIWPFEARPRYKRKKINFCLYRTLFLYVPGRAQWFDPRQ